jgi:ubiquinone/menaquinone biosynthesis C-methylase UbiE
MIEQSFGKSYAGSAPENYERYFVPAIGAPMAAALVDVAAPRPGERALDVACGTGVVARLVAERVGSTGAVAGLDANPGMLTVARSVQGPDAAIEWHQSSAEKLPFSDGAFDLVTCQMGLQFFPDKAAALREQRRVLAPGGRVALNLPGPTPPLFQAFADALARHVGPPAAGFVQVVFSLHDAGEIRALMTEAGFQDVRVEAATATLPLPAPVDFMWQYIHSTPLAGVIGQVGDEQRDALERDVADAWRAAEVDGGLSLAVRTTTVTARA